MSAAKAYDNPAAIPAATSTNQPSADSSAAPAAASAMARAAGPVASRGVTHRRKSGAPNSSATAAKWTARARTISASTKRPSWFDLEAEAAFGAVGVDREHLPVHLVPAGRKAAHRDDDLRGVGGIDAPGRDHGARARSHLRRREARFERLREPQPDLL